MHQSITGSETSITAVCYACRLWCPLPWHKWVWLNWYLSTVGWRWTASITAMSCCLSRCFQQSNDKRVAERCLFTKQYVACGEIGHFLCSVISQGKVGALDRWGGKWNHLLMTHRLTTNYAKNYCNRTLIVKVIVENVVTCFFVTQCTGCLHVVCNISNLWGFADVMQVVRIEILASLFSRKFWTILREWSECWQCLVVHYYWPATAVLADEQPSC